MPPVITHNHDMNGHILSPYMSLTHAKGLLNGPGQNNCFLNSAVQVLWHLDIFRRSFRELSGHACMMDSCIFCALKELFTQFQYSHESALPPDALRRALAETFVNQQRFQLGFMDDAAECFENILMRIHFHIANSESEDMCNAPHCIPHQKFAMTLVEQGVCHACGATSEPLPFTQMVHYISSSALCAQSKMNQEERSGGNFIEQFGQLLRKAGGLGEVRDCPSACGAKIQIQRTLMNRPEIVSIGIVWDSERPNLEHIMDVFQTIGTTVRLQDVFHSCVDDRWASTATHHLVGVVTYYGKHYSTFFFHTKLRVWIYFDDATVREIGPHWEQVVDKCRRGHFQPLLLLYANPYGDPVNTESAQKTVTYVPGHHCGDHQGRGYGPFDGIHGRGPIQQRRAVTPNPELHRDLCTDVQPRRAITPNAELHHGDGFIQRKPNYSSQMWYQLDSDPGYSSSDRAPSFPNGPQPSNSYTYYGPDPSLSYPGQAQPKAQGLYSGDLIQKLIGPSSKEGGYDQRGPLRTNGYFNNCDVPDGHQKGTFVYQQSGSHQNGTDNIYISRKAVESVLNYQKLQRHRHASGNYNGGSTAGNRNSNSSLESFENALRIRGQIGAVFPYEGKLPEVPDPAAPTVGNLPRSRDSGNWSGDRNSASSTSSASMENPYYILGSNKRQVPVQQGYRYSSGKGPAENGLRTPYDAGYDSFSLSSNDSFPVGQHGLPKHNQQLAQIPENVMDPAAKVVHNTGEFVDECQSLCMEADKFLEKSMERENTGDLDGAISLCNGAAAKARAAMDAPYSNPQILAFARMKHNSCIMRARSLHRRMLVRQDSINSHGSSSTSTEADSPRRPDGDAAGVAIHHSRQSSRDSVRSRREGTGNHSRQSSRDGGRHSRQGSRDATHTRQSSQDAAEKKRIELYGTLPKSGSKKKASLDKNRTGSMRAKDEMATMQRIESGFNMVQPTLHLAESDAYVHEAGLAKPLRPSETLFKREPSPLSTDYSEWESTRKPTLHRANSIPPNFQHDGTADGSQTYADASSKGGKDASRVGKKQHKIRRKLLMGGLIRRKNRSMPDLREGHDPSSAFDDSTLRQSEQSLDALGTHRRIPNALSLSHQNLYHETAHQRLYSSHGKIPPPPPVRTTSQLSTRSQSHGNLIYTPQSSAGHAASSLPAFALTSTERRTRSAALPEVAPPCPSVPTISGNKMTIQADVHHERTPSDNIRPVCLVRRPSANPHDALPKSVTALRIEPRTSSAPHPYSTPPPSVPVMARHHGTPAPIQPQASSDNGTENKDRDEEEPCPGGLLAELRMKRQQILNNAGTKPPQDPIPSEVKASGSTGSGWLRELQAKQQQMRNKKLDGPGGPTHYEGPTSTDTFSVLPSSHSQEDFKKQPPMKTTSVVSTNVRVPGVDTTSTSIAATNPTLPRAAVVGGPEYKPKSVRALANKFEQILLSPPVPSPNFPVPTSGPISKDMVDKQLESSKIVGNFSASQLNGVRSDEQLSSAIHGELYNGLSSPRLHSVKPAGNTDDIDGPLKGNCSSFPDVPIMKTATYNSKNVFESRPSTEQRGTSSSRCGPKSIAEDIGNLHSVNGINNGCNANANSVAYAMQTNRSQAPSSGAEWHCPPEVAGYDPRHPPNSQAVTHPHHGNFNVTRSGAYQNGTYADNLRMASHNSWPQNYYGASGNGGFGGNGIVPNGSVRLMDARTDGGFQRDLQQSSNGLPATGPSLNGVCDVGRYVAPPYDRVLPGYNPPPPVGPRAPNGARVNGVPGAASQRAPSLETNGMPQRSLSLETNGLPQWPDVDKMNQANATIGSEKGGLKKKKGKKSVTFSDQIALVASAEDSEVVPIPNPLLEKVLLKSAMASNMANKSGVNSSYTNPPRVNDHTGVQNRVESSVSPIHPLQSSPPLVPTTNHLNVNGAAPLPPYPNNPNVNKPKATGSKALCYLCGKKTVVPPVIYCLDCDFYMSRFRPKK